jgi:hypothetical protein
MTDLDGSAPVEPVECMVGPVRSLQALLDDEHRGFLPVRLSFPAVDGVVLHVEDRFADVVVETGAVRSVYTGDTARLITDPARVAVLMQHAAVRLFHEASEARQEQQEAAQRHYRVLHEIRAYAIEKRREDAICQDGLNAFLRKFDMAPDQAVVRFTITGSYTVAHGDCDTAESDGSGCVDVDLSDVDDVVDGSLSFRVAIDEVSPAVAVQPVPAED